MFWSIFYNSRKSCITEELGILVRDNLFSFNPVTGEYKPQGHSAALGLREYCRRASKQTKS